MTELQPTSRLQQTAECFLSVQEMQSWLDKAVSWGQADSSDTRKDTCQHLSRLRDFLQQLLTQINNTSSTTEIMKKLPFLGQLLGRLCWNPYVTAGETIRELLLQCLWGLHSEHPRDAVERKANQWIRKVLCQLVTEEDDVTAQALMKHMGVPAKEYQAQVLKKIVTKVQENVEKSSQNGTDESILATSEVLVPLVTCPEISPLAGTLLKHPAISLSEDFLDALSSAHSSHGLPLEEQALISLWYHRLPCLEEAVLSLLQSVTAAGSTPQNVEQQVTKSLLPKACAQHCSIFLIVNDIFRSILKQAESNQSVRSAAQTFTKCFLREYFLLQPDTSASLKDFFPQSPPGLLAPLLTMPSEMPHEALKSHLKWLSSSLQRLTEEEEEGDAGSTSTRGHHKVFEAWFLLVQCAHWVQVALQLLVTSGPEDCGPLLWLLTFYHHPTNRWHHRAVQLVQAKEAWDLLHTLYSVSPCPLSVARLQSLIILLSSQTSVASSLTFNLLVHFAVFCQLPPHASAEVLQMVKKTHFLFFLNLFNSKWCYPVSEVLFSCL
ncbi:Fanconi anemia group C protein [Austrofundulus limnaeus]|uniref:Fanconi anemia group C protein n=1 Tax=Austrofundulus limnaeus TaxID=52670 RepID=A0A2I4ARL1_AUSLI|nr:PREDICTED: Fanconi anemia group C protein [Austrofundulus limnaeus]